MAERVFARSICALVIALALCGCSAHERATSISSKPEPKQAKDTVEISPIAPTLRSASGQLRVSLDAVMEFQSGKPDFACDGVLGVAPTLDVKPGDTIRIALHNRLPPTNFTANAINIHFHGFDVSPDAPADDVVSTLAMPGQTLHYVLHVPRSQQPGLYWYHPHSHGEAYWQVASGMSGAIVVEPAIGRKQPDALLILRDVQDRPSILGVPWYARRRVSDTEISLARKLGVDKYQPVDPDDAGLGGTCSAEHGMHVTVEGTNDAGVLTIARGEQTLVRVLNASAGRTFDLRIADERLGLVEMDGYAIRAFPGNPQISWVDHIVLPPAGRAAFFVAGQQSEALLRSACYDSGPAGDRDPAVVLAKLEPVSASSDAAGASDGAAVRIDGRRSAGNGRRSSDRRLLGGRQGLLHQR
jgi:suppressor of ftsI